MAGPATHCVNDNELAIVDDTNGHHTILSVVQPRIEPLEPPPFEDLGRVLEVQPAQENVPVVLRGVQVTFIVYSSVYTGVKSVRAFHSALWSLIRGIVAVECRMTPASSD